MALLYILPTAILHMVGLGNRYTTFLLFDGMFLAIFIAASILLGTSLRYWTAARWRRKAATSSVYRR